MNFKVGDVVRIRTREDIKKKLRNSTLNIKECIFIPKMEEYTGQVSQIKDITRYGAYKLDIDNGKYNWSDYMFEPYTVEIRKLDLEDGDCCVFKNGDKAIKKGKCVVMDGGAISLREYSNKLEHNLDSNYDIVRVDRPVEYKTIYKNDEILDSTEKKYLAALIKPFKDEVKYIAKVDRDIGRQYISICHDDGLYIEDINLPDFKSGTMYVGMEPNKDYTLEELGL